MSEAGKPGDEPIHLPSWIDDAIARKRVADDPTPADAMDDTAEMSALDTSDLVEAARPTRDLVPSFLPRETTPAPAPANFAPPPPYSPEVIAPVAAAAPPPTEPEALQAERDPRSTPSPAPNNKDAMPWVIAALFFTAAALVIAWYVFIRPGS